MKKSTKAVLFSSLVFPGAGHFLLRRYFTGSLLFFVAALAIYLITSNAAQVALEVVQEIESGVALPDIESITTLVREKLQKSEEITHNSTISFIALWLIGIFDSYRIGHSIDRNSQPKRTI